MTTKQENPKEVDYKLIAKGVNVQFGGAHTKEKASVKKKLKQFLQGK